MDTEHNRQYGKSNNELNGMSVPELMALLDKAYDKQEKIVNQLKHLYALYESSKEEIEMIQVFIMFQSNRQKRRRDFGIK